MFSAAEYYTLRANVGCDGRKLVLCLSNVMVLVRQTQLDDLCGLCCLTPHSTLL